MMDHRAFCSASPAAEKQEDDELQLFDAEMCEAAARKCAPMSLTTAPLNGIRSFPMKLMPYVAVIQLSCFAVYAETVRSTTTARDFCRERKSLIILTAHALEQAYTLSGDTSQLAYAAAGASLLGALLLRTLTMAICQVSSSLLGWWRSGSTT